MQSGQGKRLGSHSSPSVPPMREAWVSYQEGQPCRLAEGPQGQPARPRPRGQLQKPPVVHAGLSLGAWWPSEAPRGLLALRQQAGPESPKGPEPLRRWLLQGRGEGQRAETRLQRAGSSLARSWEVSVLERPLWWQLLGQ